MTQNKMAFQLPKVCCRCGEKQGTNFRPIYVSQISEVGYYVLFISVRRSKYSFGVPICDDCSEILRKSDKKIKNSRIVVGVLFALGAFYFFNFGGYFFTGLIISIMVYIIAHFVFINKPITETGLGGFTGKYFWFSNRKFFKQFADLNPQFVSPHNIQQLLSQPLSSGFGSTNEQYGFLWTRSNKILLVITLMTILCLLFICFIPILKNLFH